MGLQRGDTKEDLIVSFGDGKDGRESRRIKTYAS
jgi:hypothetical protein